MLLLAGPFIDKALSSKWILDYNFTPLGAQCLALSCSVAIFVNISQFMCLGRFSAISFQVVFEFVSLCRGDCGLEWRDECAHTYVICYSWAVQG